MNFCIKREFSDETKEKPRIPRPPNAFMLYANENRKKMSQLYPTESNKDISKRLGNGWKCLNEEERKKFFERARAIGLQHKKEYPDYVYNPKEARIRKAMRDATRERSIGTSPMLPRSNARRTSAHGWMAQHDELMMSPLASMPPVCGGGFPAPSTTDHHQSYMGAMTNGGVGGGGGGGSSGGYGKMEAAPPPMPPTSSVHTDYMQSNPLAQLQQHAEMWTDYHHQEMRPRSSGNPYMMDVPSYPNQNPEMAAPIMMDKQHQPLPPTSAVSTVTSSPPHHHHHHQQQQQQQQQQQEPEQDKENSNMDTATQQENFLSSVFESNDDGSQMKKQPGNNVLHLPLSSQSFRTSPSRNDLKYQNAYIVEYFRGMPSMSLTTITTPNGTSFPYATYCPSSLFDNVRNESQVFENVTEPSFYQTDVGFIPMSSL